MTPDSDTRGTHRDGLARRHGVPKGTSDYSAAQLETITTSVAAQRRSIEALKAQLTASD
jgi:hypothetical protein